MFLSFKIENRAMDSMIEMPPRHLNTLEAFKSPGKLIRIRKDIQPGKVYIDKNLQK